MTGPRLTRRSMRWFAPAAALAMGAATLLAATPVTAHPAVSKAKTVTYVSNVFAVPGTTDVWAYGFRYSSTSTTSKVYIEHLHKGHWSSFVTSQPKGIDVIHIVAASNKSAWFSASTISNGDLLLLRISGHKLKRQTLPKRASTVNLSAFAGTTTSNVWAVGQDTADQTPVTYHWNGKKWSARKVPAFGTDQLEVGYIATSSANNAVLSANGTSGRFYVLHFNGKKWSNTKKPLTGVGLDNLITAGPKQTYLIGSSETSSGHLRLAIQRYNGKKWSMAKTPSTTENTQSSAAYGSLALVVGYSNNAAFTHTYPFAAGSTGGSFKKLTSPNAGSGIGLSDVTVGGKHFAAAIGSWVSGTGTSCKTHITIELYNGKKWRMDRTTTSAGCGG